jgi:hypothetical protein
MATRYRRGGGVFKRTAASHPELNFVNNGGHDAPLSRRGRVEYRVALFAVAAIGLTLLAFSIHH